MTLKKVNSSPINFLKPPKNCGLTPLWLVRPHSGDNDLYDDNEIELGDWDNDNDESIDLENGNNILSNLSNDKRLGKKFLFYRPLSHFTCNSFIFINSMTLYTFVI